MSHEINQPGKEKGEDFNVRTVHGQLMREKSEPTELLHAAPGWLKHGIYAPLLIGGAMYLLNASGGFNWNEYNEGPRSTVTMAEHEAQNAPVGAILQSRKGSTETLSQETKTPVDLAAEGEKVYQSVCMACHQTNGQGLPGAFPPLAGSDWVAGSEKRLAAIVLHGLMGPIEVNGQTWNSVMPPQGATLDDRKIAATLSYVRSAWGNDAPSVSPETVAKIRSEFDGHAPWTVEALEAELP